ncbi:MULTISPECIES: hypothetical protein [Streptomyces]|uniref:hypothetical protein n=1 Tax=Streptomyces TaxID=1883 RepID=UPI0006EB3356|nr:MULTISPECIES: hypothetical protein [Streptomyces]
MIGKKRLPLSALAAAALLVLTSGTAHAEGAFIAKAFNQRMVNVHWGDSCDNEELAIDIPNDALQATFEGNWDGPQAHVDRVTFINNTDFLHGFTRGEFSIEDNGQTPTWRVADMPAHSTQTIELNYTSAGTKTLGFAYPYIGATGEIGSCNLTYVGVEQ